MKTIKLMLIAASAVPVFSGCNNMPVIDKEYNPVQIVAAESSLSGTFRQGDEVANGKIILKYTNGLGRSAEVFVPEINGIYSDPVEVTLASRSETDNGSGTIEITLKGVPESKNKTTLRPTIRVATHEVFITFDVTPLADIVLDANASAVSGTFKIFQPVQNGKISVAYNTTKPHTVSISVAEVVGISGAEFTADLPPAPEGGFIDVPLQGTPMNHGSQSFVVRMVRGDVEYNMTKAITIQGEITFDIGASIVTGEFITGSALQDAFVTLAYTAGRDMNVTISIDNVDGVSAAPFTASLTEGSGTVDIPLTGTPTNDNDKKLVVTMIDENNIAYKAEITVVMNPGIDFVEETVTFNSLIYKTVFVDINGNGKATRGEVWLDRNMGATSNDPGTYGAAGANQNSFGQLIQWGKPYGAPFDSAHTIDMGTMSPWTTICPPGYEVPEASQWRDAIAALTGGTVSKDNYNVTGVDGITEKLMTSILKLPLSGWSANGGAHEQFGLQAAYWTSSEGNNSSPWKIEIKNNTATSTGSNWAGSEWQMAVRCIKTFE